ncbi:response regulator transcription factor [Mycobacterium hodleri]|uniref:response regulator transcription factor n=1 Tax=Mycolicibacterium hodleri TaxID=49897 RepID=UPI0021F28A47|nr:response regulator transcription factor [Mycolicibacterium hodleri]MCV7133925.1 response regulator transcription factor [Mycolicibacterium hodleri]
MTSCDAGAWRQSAGSALEVVSRNHLDGRQPRVLVVDAERVVAEMLSIALNASGIHTTTACDGASALSAARCSRPDLAILDLRVPDMDGRLLLDRLRESHPTMLTILLHQKSSRPTVDTDPRDWLVKPFSIEDAMSRVRRTLRNNGVDHESVRPVASVGDLVLDEEHQRVWRGGDRIVLTPTEFALMRFFVRNPCRALGIREILGRVWHYDYTGQSSQVRLYVSYLRRRVDDGRDPMIHTLRRTGYILKPSRGDITPIAPSSVVVPSVGIPEGVNGVAGQRWDS